MSDIEQDKGFAWIIMLVSFTINLIESSVYMSPAIYIVAWDNSFDVTKAQLGVATALLNGVCIIMGVFVGPIITRCGCRVPIFAGTLVCATGFVSTTFAPSIDWIYVSYGIVSGVGLGFLSIPPMVCIQYYFKKKRTFALGTSLAGHSVGALCWLPILQYLVDIFGWRGAMLLHTGLMLQILVLASFYRPINIKELEESKDENLLPAAKHSADSGDATRKSNSSDTELSRNEEDVQFIRNMSASDTREHTSDIQILEHNQNSSGEITNICIDTEHTPEIKPQKSSLVKRILNIWKFSLLTNKAFLVYIANIIVSELNMALLYHFTPIRAIKKGIHKDDVAFILSTIFVAEIIMRVLGSIFGNLSWVNRSVMTGCAVLGQGTVCILSTFCHDFLSSAILAGIYGCFTGCYFSVELTLMTDILGLENVAHGFSLLFVFNSIGIFAALPIAGFLIDITGDYNLPFYIYGALTLIPGLIYIFMHSLFDPPKSKTSEIEVKVTNDET